MTETRSLRRTLLAVAAAAALGTSLAAALACGGSRSEPARVRAGGVELEAAVAPPSLRVGENELWIELRDAQGAPIPDAELDVAVRMPAMGAMPAMGGPARVEAMGEGRYRADFALEMGGTWQLELRAARPGGDALVAEGSLTVGMPGLRLEAAGAAAGAPARAAPPAAHGAHAHGAAPVGPAPAAGEHPGEFRFDPARLRQVGVHSEPARREEVEARVRAVGRVVVDETRLVDVAARVGGFAGEVVADALGEPVTKGQVLFWMYSPELFAAQHEYQEALRSRAAARGTSTPARADALGRAAETRLRLWGIDPADVAAIARRGEPQEYLPVRAPVSGFVVEKGVVAGSPIERGARVYRIVPLDRVWIDAEVYEAEVPLVEPGMPAEVTLAYLPGRRLEARVDFVDPRLDADRRTARVRLVLPNPELALRPEMYVDVVLRRPLGARLTVPDSAVLYAGERSFVFLDLGDGRLRPQEVGVGLRSDGRVEILSGLEQGQPVVVSGTFLVAGESRLRAALEAW
jgi:Cu(I)/Ag(I) efflux system membrane fusion protein